MVGNIKRVGNNGVIGAANECCIPTEKKESSKCDHNSPSKSC